MANVHNDDDETLDFADESEWMDEDGEQEEPGEDYDPGPECDDEGGMSEVEWPHPI